MKAPPNGHTMIQFGVTQEGDLIYDKTSDTWNELTFFGIETKLYFGIARQLLVPAKIIEGHRGCSKNRETLAASKQAGCFCCCRTFDPKEISEYVRNHKDNPEGTDALCPHCGIDSVLPESESYELTEAFLQEMCNYWFRTVHPLSPDLSDA